MTFWMPEFSIFDDTSGVSDCIRPSQNYEGLRTSLSVLDWVFTRVHIVFSPDLPLLTLDFMITYFTYGSCDTASSHFPSLFIELWLNLNINSNVPYTIIRFWLRRWTKLFFKCQSSTKCSCCCCCCSSNESFRLKHCSIQSFSDTQQALWRPWLTNTPLYCHRTK